MCIYMPALDRPLSDRRYTAFRSEETAGWIKQAISLFSPCAFAYGVDVIVEFEEVEVGVTWSNLHEKVNFCIAKR